MAPAPPPASDYDRIDVNCVAGAGAFLATSKTGEVLEARDVYISNTGLALPEFNSVFLKRPSYKVQEALDRGAAYFEAKKLPYRVLARADLAEPCRTLLAGRGFSELDPLPGMSSMYAKSH